MSKVLQIQEEAGFQGGRVDIDKTVNKMNQEEKAVFECLEDEQNVFAGAYEELDDDFITMLNDGQPMMHSESKPEQPLTLIPESEHENAGVEIIKDGP